jgi:hypothetical protein
MKQLFLCHLHSYLVCFLRLILHLYLYLFWRANQMSKNRRRFVSRTLVVFYGAFP